MGGVQRIESGEDNLLVGEVAAQHLHTTFVELGEREILAPFVGIVLGIVERQHVIYVRDVGCRAKPAWIVPPAVVRTAEEGDDVESISPHPSASTFIPYRMLRAPCFALRAAKSCPGIADGDAA